MKNEIIKIPGFPSVERNLISKYLQNDIDDDWFQDPIRYQDYLKLNKEVEYITNNEKENGGNYNPSKSERYLVPKPNFTVRYSLEIDYYERWFYFYLTIPLIKKFDPLLPRRIFNHRYNSHDHRYLYFNHIQQWSKFGGVVRSQLNNNDKVLIEADIQTYYENIDLGFLQKDLRDCVNKTALELNEMKELNESVDCIVKCLKEWSLDGTKGIPQKRDCSSFLANIYMLDIDLKMIGAGFEYYRYMDDIRIICNDVYEARRGMLLLVDSLRVKNLSLNSKKTKIIESGSDEFKEYVNPKFELQSIDLLLRTKRKANIAIGYSLVKDLLLSLINRNYFDSKEFRFCITRISKLARCKDYKLPDGYFNIIIDGVIDSLTICPTSTDSAFEFLSSVNIQDYHIKKITNYLENEEQSIYEWQNYWLWKLIIVHSIHEETLTNLALKIINDPKRSNIDKAGAILYIAKNGNKEQLINVRDKFASMNSVVLQRHSFFAMKALDWKKELQQIVGNVNKRLNGNFKIIRNSINEIVVKPSPVKITEILSSVHQYE